jgi:hypothetical protein
MYIIWLQIFNQINSRKIKDEYNPFAGLLSSATFLDILVIEVALQVPCLSLLHCLLDAQAVLPLLGCAAHSTNGLTNCAQLSPKELLTCKSTLSNYSCMPVTEQLQHWWRYHI